MSARAFRRHRERTHHREARRRRRLAIAAGAALGATAFGAPVADAATYTVTNLSDNEALPPVGSLRAAIIEANNDATPDLIVFQSGLTGTITLDDDDLDINEPVEIQGPGPQALTISGNDADRVFDIYIEDQQARGLASNAVTISGLTATDGHIYNDEGAGIRSTYADLTLANTVVTGNNLTATFDDLTGWGGGVQAVEGGLVVRNSTISDNSITYEPGMDRSGRGIDFYAGWGGGIYIGDDMNVLIENSTISGNSASYGGGIVIDQDETNDSVDINNSTIADNIAGEAGGGIYHKYGIIFRGESAPSRVDLLSTIVGDNTAPTGPDISTGGALSVDAGFSLIEDTSGATIVPTGPNVTGQDPQLGALANNGGPTDTHLPAAASPALDKGVAGGLTTDQRGEARTKDDAAIANAAGGDGTDIGAVEGSGATELAARPSCRGEKATIVGTNGNDVIVGTPGPDVIKGLRGKDVIKGVAGDDVICGDAGVDKIKAGTGDDEVKGGDAGDRIKGGEGDDVLRGGNGVDKISGQAGNDDLFGGAKKGPKGGPARGKSPGNVCKGGKGTDTASGCETVTGVP